MDNMLNSRDHSRDSAGMTYIYPVVSRRAGGVSIGINLNTNNACNWACVYCQVPGLVRGGPDPVDLRLLEDELRGFLRELAQGDFMARRVPVEARRLVDVAFSGNGEPTAAAEFGAVVRLLEKVLGEFPLTQGIKIRLITNGSLLHRLAVRQAIAHIGALGGEVWFKVDRARAPGILQVNGVRLAPARQRAGLLACARLAPTWVQTCFFAFDAQEPEETELQAYLDLLRSVRDEIKGVHLYGMARPSLHPAAARLSTLPRENLEGLGARIAALGLTVVVTP